MTHVVSFRVQQEELAKALDGLLEKGNSIDEINISNIVRNTFYYGILSLCKNPSSPASQKSLKRVYQLLNQKKKIIRFEEIMQEQK